MICTWEMQAYIEKKTTVKYMYTYVYKNYKTYTCTRIMPGCHVNKFGRRYSKSADAWDKHTFLVVD